MKKIIPFALIATSALVLSGCTTKSTPTTQTPKDAAVEIADFAKALESGKPTLCTMTKGTDKLEYQIKGQQIHITSVINIDDPEGKDLPTTAHTINDGSYIYSWSDAVKSGIKTKVPQATATPSQVPEAANTQPTSSIPEYNLNDFRAHQNEGYTISCQNSNFDDSIFTPPSDIQFSDLSEGIPATPTTPPTESNADFDVKKFEEDLVKKYGVPIGEGQ